MPVQWSCCACVALRTAYGVASVYFLLNCEVGYHVKYNTVEKRCAEIRILLHCTLQYKYYFSSSVVLNTVLLLCCTVVLTRNVLSRNAVLPNASPCPPSSVSWSQSGRHHVGQDEHGGSLGSDDGSCGDHDPCRWAE